MISEDIYFSAINQSLKTVIFKNLEMSVRVVFCSIEQSRNSIKNCIENSCLNKTPVLDTNFTHIHSQKFTRTDDK